MQKLVRIERMAENRSKPVRSGLWGVYPVFLSPKLNKIFILFNYMYGSKTSSLADWKFQTS